MPTRPALRLALGFLGALATTVGAQTRSVRIHVADTTGAAIPAATVSLLSPDNSLLATGATDTSGVGVLRISASSNRLQLVVQRLGFLGTRRLVRTSDGEAPIEIALAPVSASLDTVRVSDRSTRLAAEPVIRGDEIASSTRNIYDFVDVLKKLRAGLLTRINNDIEYKCHPGRKPSRFGFTSTSGPSRIFRNVRRTAPWSEVRRDRRDPLRNMLRQITQRQRLSRSRTRVRHAAKRLRV